MPACADMGQYLLEMHQYTPQPTKHRSEDRAHNKGQAYAWTLPI